ncbi:ADP-ribosylation factor-like isoform X2 [Pecten maximus]|uniref:ADP-ribosylation factor-like isoform X1 n=1 Tax=Pecten maximus TaxID=6579 RepID=UPI0014589A50|nr:ADP-ribosylation factor-like isoform X1 [Pecten maximus]XP_033735513.1 ADP-ribosylation factor-like isoform X2 [Pecten maximus]
MGATCSSGGTKTLAVNLSYTELEYPQKILMVGPSGAGKTHLLYSWKLGSQNVVEPVRTSDFNVEQIRATSGHSFMVFDLSGSPSFRVRRRQFYQGTEGIVFVVDSTCMGTKEMDDARQDLVSVLHDRDLVHTPLLIIGNKQDLSGALPLEDLEAALGLKAALTTKRVWKMIEVCALSEESVHMALDALVQLVGASELATTRTTLSTATTELDNPKQEVATTKSDLVRIDVPKAWTN